MGVEQHQPATDPEDPLRYSYEAFLAELGVKLRQMRIDRGWTLRHMIVTHGFHLAHWQGFEKGKGISVPSLLRVCEVFDTSVEELVAGLGVVGLDTSKSATPPAQQSSRLPKRKASPVGTPVGPGARSPRRQQP